MSKSASYPRVLAGKTVEGPISARMRIDGRPYINFFGAGYLALSNVPAIRDAVRHAFEQGTPFAQQLPPVHGAIDPIFDRTERAAAQMCRTEASVYFASGYFIGSVGLSSFETSFDLLLLDEQAHYSLRDGAKLSGLPVVTFAHCDPESLHETLKGNLRPAQRPVVLTDGAFATTGRVPPLAEYAAVIEGYDGRLLIDESHAFGVVGENGRGAAEYCGVEQIAIAGATLSKALCANGAIVGCTASAAERLRIVAPIGAATAGSPLSAAAAAASLTYVAEHPELRKTLHAQAEHLRIRLRSAGFDVIHSPAPIVTFRFGTRSDMQALQRRAFDRGIYIHYSNYIGAGPEGVIRCAVFRDHSSSDIDALIDSIA